MTVLISGGAGNLGSCLARFLLGTQHEVRLLVHRTGPPADLAQSPRVAIYRGNLANPETLKPACEDADCIVHLAGVLFAPRPDKFLHKTNIGFVQNLLSAARGTSIKKFILVSFPHVEGETTPDHPATDRLESTTGVVHFQTRLIAERVVLASAGTPIVPVILRAGFVYGTGVKLIEAARRLGRYRLLAIWRKPTWIHLIALPDFLAAVRAAIEQPHAHGIYNICDDAPLTAQEFLDRLAIHFGYGRPLRLPEWAFRAAAAGCELFAAVFRTAAPLTRDIVRAGMTSAVADTSRMKRELLSQLEYPTLAEGIHLV